MLDLPADAKAIEIPVQPDSPEKRKEKKTPYDKPLDHKPKTTKKKKKHDREAHELTKDTFEPSTPKKKKKAKKH